MLIGSDGDNDTYFKVLPEGAQIRNLGGTMRYGINDG